MKMHISKVLAQLLLVFMLIPYIVFAHDSFRPRIRNYGVYKDVSPSLKGLLHPLLGHVPRDVDNAVKIAPLARNKRLKLSIVLPLNNEDELDERLIELTSPNKAPYQNFLSHEDFVTRYSPTEEQVDSAQSYLRTKGFIVEAVDPNRLIMHVSASVGSINAVFNTEISHYVAHDGQAFYAPSYELQVDSNLKIQGVQGLENRIKASSKLSALPQTKISGIENSETTMSQALTPANIRAAYSLPNNLTGTGQTLALFELDGYKASDITAYEDAYGLPHVPLQNILVDGVDGSAGDGGGEVTLDIELMIAVAPGVAKILVYEGPNTGSGLIDTYNKIATDNLANSISTSWGLSETSTTGSIIQAENSIFKQMAAQGQTLYAAAGDSGAYDNGSTLGVDDPASQPFVVGVGGTTLYTNSDGSYSREKTWSSGSGPGNSGGGGGISSLWSIPPWQQGVISSGSKGSTSNRNVPDVALDSDPSTGYAIYYNGQWQAFGGTSCAAPLWAAFTALVNQARANAQKSSLGFPNPTFYQIGQSSSYSSTFHDINDNSTNGYYPAVSGYDLATGWGSFKADQLLAYLGGSTTPPPATCTHNNPTLSIMPASQQGLAGAALTYSLSLLNNDTSECTASSFNLNAIVPSGFSQSLGQSVLSVAPNQSAQTTLVLTSDSASAAGNYNFSVKGTNAQDSSFTSSASGVYGVQNPQNQQLTLNITPENGVFKYHSNRYAEFTIKLMNGSTGLRNKIHMSVQGPASWSSEMSTGRTGTVVYGILLNRFLPLGQYQMTLSSTYDGNTVTKQTNFTVVR